MLTIPNDEIQMMSTAIESPMRRRSVKVTLDRFDEIVNKPRLFRQQTTQTELPEQGRLAMNTTSVAGSEISSLTDSTPKTGATPGMKIKRRPMKINV